VGIACGTVARNYLYGYSRGFFQRYGESLVFHHFPLRVTIPDTVQRIKNAETAID
jgi:hypothetical protein